MDEQRFFNVPLLVDYATASWLASAPRIALKLESTFALDAGDMPALLAGLSYSELARSEWVPFGMRGSEAIIPIRGSLLHGVSYMDSWVTGYDAIRTVFDMAMADEDVESIGFDIKSSGGEVAGMFDLADHIYDSRGAKPITAYVNESAFSAAYGLASAADQIVLPRSGMVGSVGVVQVHTDMSRMLNNVGIKPTLLFAGKHKVDGNPFEALPQAVRKDMQARLESVYDMFVSTVARNRGMDEEDVRKTEARIFSATDAVDIGFADAVTVNGKASEAAPEGAETKASVSVGEITMTELVAPEAATPAVEINVEQERSEATQAERARISEILGCDEAQERQTLAHHLALKTSLSVDEAKAILANSAVEEQDDPQEASQFDRAMAATENPNVGSGAVEGDAPVQVGIDYTGIYGRLSGRSH